MNILLPKEHVLSNVFATNADNIAQSFAELGAAEDKLDAVYVEQAEKLHGFGLSASDVMPNGANSTGYSAKGVTSEGIAVNSAMFGMMYTSTTCEEIQTFIAESIANGWEQPRPNQFNVVSNCKNAKERKALQGAFLVYYLSDGWKADKNKINTVRRRVYQEMANREFQAWLDAKSTDELKAIAESVNPTSEEADILDPAVQEIRDRQKRPKCKETADTEVITMLFEVNKVIAGILAHDDVMFQSPVFIRAMPDFTSRIESMATEFATLWTTAADVVKARQADQEARDVANAAKTEAEEKASGKRTSKKK